jgi:hypothetical protein
MKYNKVKIVDYEILARLSNGKTIDISKYYNKDFHNKVMDFFYNLENDFPEDFQESKNE